MKSITLPRAIKPLHHDLLQQMKQSKPVKGAIICVKDDITGESKNFRVKDVSKEGSKIELEDAE